MMLKENNNIISTHTSLAGRDGLTPDELIDAYYISTHTSLAGRDGFFSEYLDSKIGFLLTRPSRDVT